MTGWDETDRRMAGVFLGAVLPLLVASTLVSVRTVLQNANVALILVVVVVFIAAVGGRAAGALAAVSSALSFNFFHTKPYLRLTIDSADDVETTVLLLAVGLLVGHLAAGRRQARRFARNEIRRIHRMGGFTAQGEETPVVILAAEAELVDLLGLTACRFEAPPSPLVLPRIERTGTLDVGTYRFRPEGFELPADGVELPVYGRGTLLGRFVLEATPGVGISLERRVLAVAIADQVGAALAAEGTAGTATEPAG
jgi:hypothetical protein